MIWLARIDTMECLCYWRITLKNIQIFGMFVSPRLATSSLLKNVHLLREPSIGTKWRFAFQSVLICSLSIFPWFATADQNYFSVIAGMKRIRTMCLQLKSGKYFPTGIFVVKPSTEKFDFYSCTKSEKEFSREHVSAVKKYAYLFGCIDSKLTIIRNLEAVLFYP